MSYYDGKVRKEKGRRGKNPNARQDRLVMAAEQKTKLAVLGSNPATFCRWVFSYKLLLLLFLCLLLLSQLIRLVFFCKCWQWWCNWCYCCCCCCCCQLNESTEWDLVTDFLLDGDILMRLCRCFSKMGRIGFFSSVHCLATRTNEGPKNGLKIKVGKDSDLTMKHLG